MAPPVRVFGMPAGTRASAARRAPWPPWPAAGAKAAAGAQAAPALPAAVAATAPAKPVKQLATPSDGRVHTQNVVATFELCTTGNGKLNLVHIIGRLATHGAGAGDFNATKFAACKIRIPSPKCTCLVFASGKAVVTGAQNELFSLLAAHKFVHILRRAGFAVKLRNFRYENLVGSVNYGHKIDLAELAAHNSIYANFFPTLFPGCVYRNLVPRVVFLIYESGLVVVTGARSRDELNQGHARCTEIVARFATDGTDLHAAMRSRDARAARDGVAKLLVDNRAQPAQPALPPVTLGEFISQARAAGPGAVRRKTPDTRGGGGGGGEDEDGGDDYGSDGDGDGDGGSGAEDPPPVSEVHTRLAKSAARSAAPAAKRSRR